MKTQSYCTFISCCASISSLFDNLNYSDIADLFLYFSNNSLNIKSLSILMLSSFLWFLSFEVGFLNVNFLYPTCEENNITLIIFISLKVTLPWILVFNCHLFYQTFKIIVVHPCDCISSELHVSCNNSGNA